jgi:hypothetical protein
VTTAIILGILGCIWVLGIRQYRGRPSVSSNKAYWLAIVGTVGFLLLELAGVIIAIVHSRR